MDHIHDHAVTGIERLELELLVRDFTTVLNEGQSHDIAAFLHEHVCYRPSRTQLVRGRRSVLAMLEEVRLTFDVMQTSLDAVSVNETVVLVEQTIILALPGSAAQRLMGFASYRFSGLQISDWHQIHA